MIQINSVNQLTMVFLLFVPVAVVVVVAAARVVLCCGGRYLKRVP